MQIVAEVQRRQEQMPAAPKTQQPKQMVKLDAGATANPLINLQKNPRSFIAAEMD